MICPLSKRIIETIHSQRQSFHLQGNENGFFGGASLIVQLVKNLPAMQETWIQFLDSIPGFNSWKIPWRKKPTPVFLPGESHGERSLAGHSPQGHKSRAQ